MKTEALTANNSLFGSRIAFESDTDTLVCAPSIRMNREECLHHSVARTSIMHVNDYDREVKLPDENPTIGLLLCKSARKTVVELTLPNIRQLHAKEPERSGDSQPREAGAARRASETRQYQLYLPSKELLKQKLDEWSADASR